VRTIAGEGVTLEPQLASHAPELYAVIADPSLYEFIDSKEPANEAALRERIARLESRQSPDGTEHWLNWVVRNPAGEVVGYVQATVTPDHAAEIAYVLGRAHWRKGYASAACAAMIGELRSGYGVTRLTATLDPANTASLALLRKLGLGLVWEDKPAEEVGYALDLTTASVK
jgi:[ribosomal protein S5]-alanine N-acetyltransferase